LQPTFAALEAQNRPEAGTVLTSKAEAQIPKQTKMTELQKFEAVRSF
jgi:hypothetical protein